jgi:hypothetical protein
VQPTPARNIQVNVGFTADSEKLEQPGYHGGAEKLS